MTEAWNSHPVATGKLLLKLGWAFVVVRDRTGTGTETETETETMAEAFSEPRPRCSVSMFVMFVISVIFAMPNLRSYMYCPIEENSFAAAAGCPISIYLRPSSIVPVTVHFSIYGRLVYQVCALNFVSFTWGWRLLHATIEGIIDP